MNLKQITVFTSPEQVSRFDRFKTQVGSEVIWQFFSPASEEEFSQQIDIARTTSLSVRLDGQYINMAEKHLKESSREVLKLKAADAFILQLDRYWPKAFLVNAIIQKISQDIKSLDINGAALIIGRGSVARMGIEAAVKMGFRRISWLSEAREDEAQKWIASFKNYYFGIDFVHLEPEQLTMQPGNSSLVILNLDLTLKNQLVNDLSYFNFVKKEALVVNLYLSVESGAALKEAQEVGLRTIDAKDVYGLADELWWNETKGLLNEKPDKSLVTKNVTE